MKDSVNVISEQFCKYKKIKTEKEKSTKILELSVNDMSNKIKIILAHKNNIPEGIAFWFTVYTKILMIWYYEGWN